MYSASKLRLEPDTQKGRPFCRPAVVVLSLRIDRRDRLPVDRRRRDESRRMGTAHRLPLVAGTPLGWGVHIMIAKIHPSLKNNQARQRWRSCARGCCTGGS